MTITAGLDIDLLTAFTLAPWQYGNLTLLAGRNINGLLANGLRASIYMPERSDALAGQPGNDVYGPQTSAQLAGYTGWDASGFFTPVTRIPQL